MNWLYIKTGELVLLCTVCFYLFSHFLKDVRDRWEEMWDEFKVRPFLMLSFFPIGNCLFPIEHFSAGNFRSALANCFCWSYGNVEGVCSKDCQQFLKRWRAYTNAGGTSHEPNSRFRVFANPAVVVQQHQKGPCLIHRAHGRCVCASYTTVKPRNCCSFVSYLPSVGSTANTLLCGIKHQQ